MKSSTNPLLLKDILLSIFPRLPKSDFQNANLVCKKWHQVETMLVPRKGLINDFHIPEEVVSSLKSVGLVYSRLMKIFKRSKVTFLNEHKLFQLYCAGGSINDDFLHFLDNDEEWFKQHFSNKHLFYLDHCLRSACIIGNLDLVKFLIEVAGCKPKSIHTSLAASSGDFELVTYLIEIKKTQILTESGNNIFHHAIHSGNVALVKYLINKFNYHPSSDDFESAITSSTLEMVRYFHDKYQFAVKDIDLFQIEHCRNFRLLKYLIEDLGWIPNGRDISNPTGQWHITGAKELLDAAYSMGMLEFVEYVENKFSTVEVTQSTLENAIESGNLETLNHFIRRYNVTPEKFKSLNNDQYLLLKAIESGNLSTVKHFVNKCGLIPKRDDLLKYATQAKSGRVNMVKYLIENHGYNITSSNIQDAGHEHNLELISFLFNKCKDIKTSDIDYFCQYADSAILVYHLINNANYPASKKMLESAFSGYKWHIGKDQISLFIKYLIDIHHLEPTEEMDKDVNEKMDNRMLSIFHHEAIVDKNDDDYERMNQCTIL